MNRHYFLLSMALCLNIYDVGCVEFELACNQSQKNPLILPYHQDHKQELKTIFLDNFSSLFPSMPGYAAELLCEEWLKNRYIAGKPDTSFHAPATIQVARFNEQVCGFVGYHKSNDKEYIPGIITLLAVQHEYRNKGCGTLLIKKALKDLADHTRIHLMCKPSVVKFYEKFQFKRNFSDSMHRPCVGIVIPRGRKMLTLRQILR